jgi:O-acetyl-ADP-ribose deacetylase (regulator of RNase III)
MIEEVKGNLLESDAVALVNTVNCVGFMGKGIALQFKKAFPDNFNAYQKACKANEVQPGRMFTWKSNDMFKERFIINFPTKRHWREKSRMEDIEAGLDALVDEVKRLGIQSIAIPPLGCGLGGLPWSEVRALIVEAFEQVPGVLVLLYAPHGGPDADKRVYRTERPKMTVARALFIKLMKQYFGLDYQLTQLEVQNLVYFLQEAGEPLRLHYAKHVYGPYAENLNKVLELMDGHFIRGYSCCGSNVALHLLPGAVQEADSFLAQEGNGAVRHLESVAELITGFETPYGMELLASVHWVVSKEAAKNKDEAVDAVHAWNERKRRNLKPEHIHLAFDHLKQTGWI